MTGKGPYGGGPFRVGKYLQATGLAGAFLLAGEIERFLQKQLRGSSQLFCIEAVKYNVLPLDNSKVERLDVRNRPSHIRGINQFTYYDGMARIPKGGAPDLKNKSLASARLSRFPRTESRVY